MIRACLVVRILSGVRCWPLFAHSISFLNGHYLFWWQKTRVVTCGNSWHQGIDQEIPSQDDVLRSLIHSSTDEEDGSSFYVDPFFNNLVFLHEILSLAIEDSWGQSYVYFLKWCDDECKSSSSRQQIESSLQIKVPSICLNALNSFRVRSFATRTKVNSVDIHLRIHLTVFSTRSLEDCFDIVGRTTVIHSFIHSLIHLFTQSRNHEMQSHVLHRSGMI
jgi:hypothetical protein